MSIRKRQEKDERRHLIGDGREKKDMEKGGILYHGDGQNIVLLFILYTLQGIPLGLCASVPMIMINRGVSYKQQAEFSLVSWPFSMKLLWAPIVDSLYIQRFGKRKTWLVPTQFLIGFFMYLLSFYIDDWLYSVGKNGDANIGLLTISFFILNFLAATQDIAVDGWALTMLHKTNVGHASTCNGTGQTFGYFLGYVLFMALESADFCNNYLRSKPEPYGIVTLSDFLYFWSIIFVVTTTLVALFKKENKTYTNQNETKKNEIEEGHEMNIKEAYYSLLKIIKLPSMKLLVVILFTCKIAFSPTDVVSPLKLVEAGFPKETLGLMAVPLIPFQVFLVFVVSKYTSGPKPLSFFVKAIPYRLAYNFIGLFIVWLVPLILVNGHIPLYFYILLLIAYSIHQIFLNLMAVAMMAFFAKISDPAVGGTYMTLLNTLFNLGGTWPQTLSLWFVDSLTWANCNTSNITNSTIVNNLSNNTCSNADEKKICKEWNGNCDILIDGFYVETVICFVIGVIWLIYFKKKLHYLQSLKESAWRIAKTKKNKLLM